MIANSISALLGRKISNEEFRKLKTVIIANGVENIYDRAFFGCTNLTSVFIPDSVHSIGSEVFYSCDNLKSIVIDKNNKVFDSRDDCNAIINSKNNTLLIGCNASTIPDGVKRIRPRAFDSCRDITSLRIPKSMISFTVNTIPYRTKIKSIVVDEKNSTFDSRGSCNAIIRTEDNTLIIGCNSSIVPKGVNVIGERAFEHCIELESLIIPEGVTTIRQKAFFNCRRLTSITLPSSLRIIERKAFVSCESLTSISIPEGVTSIGDDNFVRCDNMKTVYLPNSLESIGMCSFVPRNGRKYIVPKGSKEKYRSLLGSHLLLVEQK